MIYMITYNNTQGYSEEKILHTIKDSAHVKDWWHYLPHTYLLETDLSTQAITKDMTSLYPGMHFLVIKVDLEGANGLLYKEAWEWINAKGTKKLRLKSITAPPVASDEMYRKALEDKLREYGGGDKPRNAFTDP